MSAVDAEVSFPAASTSGGVVITAELTPVCTPVAVGIDGADAAGPRPDGVVAVGELLGFVSTDVARVVGVALGEGSLVQPKSTNGAPIAKATSRWRSAR
jgi:hypothetical protein